ncbi:DUF3052 domain-containing protein [Microbacterium resistens]|uniref:DUF3052 domain-containing protein n=1 Tax=Microbacterium resistens TaxID=156977 RepID=UPI001C5611F5|nr:DUF3052 domain-containing protein [Microbacterium resistens]MBW1640658.1 DUF3052 domain-containing protein [Microbacterium resistens]
MTKTTAEKLLIKPGNTLFVMSAGEEEQSLLLPLPDAVVLTDGFGVPADVAVLFAPDRATLDSRLDVALPRLREARAVWIAYPKGNRTDINRDSIWRRMEELGWTLTANVALDEVWSAVRGKPVG